MRILVVEDELDLQEAIAEGLRLDGYAVDTCGDGNKAYELLFVENYDLVLLDLNLPGMDGIEVLSKIREEKPLLKIMILSARSSVFDKVKGLDLGANDYLVKPFDFEELEARIRNLLRRKFVQEKTILECGKITINISNHNVTIEDKEIKLTNKEYGILEYFMLNHDRLISQEELIEHIWNAEMDSFSSTVRVHLASLRKKLKKELGFNPIITKIGSGYLFQSHGE